MTAESPGSPADQLRKIEEDWARAMVNKNVGRIGKIEAPEFEFITPDGKVRDREEDLASIRHTSLSDFTNSDVQIRVYGDTAVVSGVGHMKGMENGKDVSGDYRFTDVFVKNNGQWQAVHSESTKIAP
jgi:ketosteroid isomerase-like protein